MKYFLTLLIAAVIIAGPHAYARDLDIAISAGVERYSGYTLYQIGGKFTAPDGSEGNYQFPLSELKFPLDVYMMYFGAEAAIFRRIVLRLGIETNTAGGFIDFSKNAGKMEDSDWGIWFIQGYPWARYDSLDIFSRSSAELDGVILDSAAGIELYRSGMISFTIGAGFLYQYFDYVVRDLDQWYPSYEEYSAYLPPEYAGNDLVPGRVITYEVKYRIPYAEASISLRPLKRLSLWSRIAFSPLVSSDDVDDHLLRSKLSKGSAQGSAVIFNIEAECRIRGNWSAGLYSRFIYMVTEGNQDQSFYEDTPEGPEGPIGTIENRLESHQLSTGIMIEYSF